MSRVGKNPVVVPAGVTVDLKGQALKVKGKRGELALVVHDDVEVSRDGAMLDLKPNDAQQSFEEHRGDRNIVLKARQMGLTTWIAARSVNWRCRFKL